MAFNFGFMQRLKSKLRGIETDDSGSETPGLYHSRIGQPHKASFVLINTITGLLVVMLLWAAFSRVDEVTHAEGRMIPSAKMQVLQNMEGGIVEKINVQQGDLVDKGQVLVTLSSTQFVADFETKKQQVLSLMAKEARLMAEVQDKPLVFAADFSEMAKIVVMVVIGGFGTFVVENRPGAGSTVAGAIVASANAGASFMPSPTSTTVPSVSLQNFSAIANFSIARSSSGRFSLGLTQPKSPPFDAELSSEYCLANSAKSSPCSARSRIISMRCFASFSLVTSFTLIKIWRK